MTTLLTITCELALPWLLWTLWRQAQRADQEIEALLGLRREKIPPSTREPSW
jgi:hypothetical protein